MTKNTAPK